MEIVTLIVFIILSILFISKGADWLTDSLIPLAKQLKTTSAALGLVLISIVVSLPEILVAVLAGLAGYSEISLGVALGSIICNIGLMTGLSAIVKPLKSTMTLVLRDGIMSIIVPILVLAISENGEISRLEGLAIFLLFIPYLINIYLQERRARQEERQEIQRDLSIELELIGLELGKIKAGWLSFVAGSIFLLGGSYIFSLQLNILVESFALHPLFVGITLGALVPSLPNIVAAYKATQRGLTEVAISETLGSNIFTLLVTVGVVSMVTPIQLNRQWLIFDIPVMMIMSFILFFFMSTGRSISRKEGWVLLSSYFLTLFIQILIFRK